jgi:hypothetical protein
MVQTYGKEPALANVRGNEPEFRSPELGPV